MYGSVVEFECIGSRILRISFQGLWCVVVVYDPTERDCKERERFYNELDIVVDRVGNMYRLMMVETLMDGLGIVGGVIIQLVYFKF